MTTRNLTAPHSQSLQLDFLIGESVFIVAQPSTLAPGLHTHAVIIGYVVENHVNWERPHFKYRVAYFVNGREEWKWCLTSELKRRG